LSGALVQQGGCNPTMACGGPRRKDGPLFKGRAARAAIGWR